MTKPDKLAKVKTFSDFWSLPASVDKTTHWREFSGDMVFNEYSALTILSWIIAGVDNNLDWNAIDG